MELLKPADANFIWASKNTMKTAVKCQSKDCKFPAKLCEQKKYGDKSDTHWVIEHIKGTSNNPQNINIIHFGCIKK
ncbi:hypothetical protein [Spiroplasma endosymbiont of Crioceris asparagi]|uniref:hypothetical protein n=1 Tax=Spiroplasma endosymbiont of Crioceris asparagi TaxID=3066286 RepID=UPI0030CFBBE3